MSVFPMIFPLELSETILPFDTLLIELDLQNLVSFIKFSEKQSFLFFLLIP